MIYPKYGDCYIISYPKAGRSWLRCLIGKFLFDNAGVEPESLSQVVSTKFWKNAGVSNIWFSHDPLLGRAHILGYPTEMLDDNKSAYKDIKVILLIRDPRDILVSLYFQKTEREMRKPKDETLKTLSTYVMSEKAGIDCIIKFYNEWSKYRNVPKNVMLLKYEDMVADIEKELRRILTFFDISILRSEAVKNAIEFSSFESMHKREGDKAYGQDNTMNVKNQEVLDSFKARRGVVGGFPDYLSNEEINFLNRKLEELDGYYGYTFTEVW